MKKILLFSAFMLAYYCSNAQTNTFPSSGNVGIGTTSPINLLHITGNLGSADILRLSTTDATDGRSTILFTSAKGSQTWQFGQNPGGGAGIFGLRDMTTSGNPVRFVVNTSGYFGIGTITPVSLLNVNGSGSNANGILDIQSSDAGARGTLIRSGFYGYTSQDNSGNYYQSWGMRLNGSDNLWYRTYTGANNYLPYTQLSTGGTIVFGGATSNLTTDANPTLNPSMTINVGTGNVGIGSINPANKLDVNGTIHSKSVLVDLNGWSDYVFKKDYPLLSLGEVKAYIDQNHHLPEMPSEQEMIKNGLNVSEMNKLLTKKVEELTLYLIEKDKKGKEQEIRINKLEKQLEELAKRMESKSSNNRMR